MRMTTGGLVGGERGDADNLLSIEARYANYFKIGHNAYEFLLDFGLFYLEVSRPQMHTRIITNPSYAKALSRTLGDSLEQYERTYGRIPEPNDDTSAEREDLRGRPKDDP